MQFSLRIPLGEHEPTYSLQLENIERYLPLGAGGLAVDARVTLTSRPAPTK